MLEPSSQNSASSSRTLQNVLDELIFVVLLRQNDRNQNEAISLSVQQKKMQEH